MTMTDTYGFNSLGVSPESNQIVKPRIALPGIEQDRPVIGLHEKAQSVLRPEPVTCQIVKYQAYSHRIPRRS